MGPKVQKEAYLTVSWLANDKRLVFESFDMLKTNDNLRRGIWPWKGDNVSGSNKVVISKGITKKLLEPKTKYKHLMTGPGPLLTMEILSKTSYISLKRIGRMQNRH